MKIPHGKFDLKDGKLVKEKEKSVYTRKHHIKVMPSNPMYSTVRYYERI